MRRRVQVIHLARARIWPLVRRLKSTPVSEWSEHLKLAWEILRDDLEITEKNALKLIADSMSAAQVCAEAINRRSDNIVELKSRAKIRVAFKRLANCCRRASVKLRRRLDEAIGPILRRDRVDLEVIEEILDATAVEFEISSSEGTAATALRTMFVTEQGREPNNWVKNNYAGLRPDSQRDCEAALSKLRKKRGNVSASAVFEALASSLDQRGPRKAGPEVSILIRNYVANIASIWRCAGLHPARARDPYDPIYKSKFHRFSDLILTALAEPWTCRHDGDLDHILKSIYEIRAKLPDEFRTVSAALRQCDQGWLVSEHILRQALRLRIQK
jgi:hypothetical protein